MQRPRIQIVRRPRAGSSNLVAVSLIGLGLGLVAGVVAGELLRGRKLRPTGRKKKVESDAKVIAIRSRLRRDAGLAALRFVILKAGPHAVELHGWVPTRLERSRALRLAREAAEPGIHVVDCLLVHGEDDIDLPDLSDDDELETA
ncbi:MAG: hypothetical protein ABI647_04555 [Gemmatimonadota bacterium]